jgi:hypothetical protein
MSVKDVGLTRNVLKKNLLNLIHVVSLRSFSLFISNLYMECLTEILQWEILFSSVSQEITVQPINAIQKIVSPSFLMFFDFPKTRFSIFDHIKSKVSTLFMVSEEQQVPLEEQKVSLEDLELRTPKRRKLPKEKELKLR